MDWFLYERDLRHEKVKVKTLWRGYFPYHQLTATSQIPAMPQIFRYILQATSHHVWLNALVQIFDKAI